MGTKVQDTSEAQHVHVGRFSLSISDAMRSQLMRSLEVLQCVPLIPEHVDHIERRPGIYQLFLDGKSVYVGKADENLGARISQHHRKISGRRDTDGNSSRRLVERMEFRCMYIDEDLDALGPEKILISQLRPEKRAAWNSNGFGNKDVGKERDTSAVKWLHFDRTYQIDLDLIITPVERATKRHTYPVDSLYEAMTVLKTAFPFTFRFGRSHADKGELLGVDVSAIDITGSSRTVRSWLDLIADHLPAGWKIVALPGYVLAYKTSDIKKYRSRIFVWHAEGGHHTFEENEPEWGKGNVPEE
ncbi:GIY-YIG nuclease family protein [Pseudarthrobacter sp. NKDBFgelt]|uniref:GIY-YIG nuclease family protein n=1 Tax=Pseudarthrobacter sp. NKDBFgelt TaxID=3384443 RepID=UPI0038D3F440